jgi:predicted DNA-binding protein (MmcQ/YjbR family)
MTLKKLKPFLLNYLGSIEEYPWGPSPMVIKVGGKIFAIVGLESNPVTISLKCDPEDAIIQRCLYLVIQPGYHLNKEHWNTVTLDKSIPDEVVYQLIDESYTLVSKKLTKKTKDDLGILCNLMDV